MCIWPHEWGSEEMSLFDADDEKAKEAISFFNGLSVMERTSIVLDLSPDTIGQTRRYGDVEYLISLIRRDIGMHNDISIGNRLMELGLEETWARLLVVNIQKHEPTVGYLVNQISKIELEKFEDVVGGVMDAVWIEKTSNVEVTEKFGTSRDQINCIMYIAQWYVYDVMMGDANSTTIWSAMTKNGLSPDRADTLLRAMERRQKDWYRIFIFHHTRDNYDAIQEVKKQNAAILEALDDIQAQIKEQKPSRNTQ